MIIHLLRVLLVLSHLSSSCGNLPRKIPTPFRYCCSSKPSPALVASPGSLLKPDTCILLNEPRAHGIHSPLRLHQNRAERRKLKVHKSPEKTYDFLYLPR
ncbi:hypothetical protein EDB80DRAFT_411115 [Ilyonectria destructans]|nr:hypothetical protein EDB80DRAFT_411115 [Ilyonectria destructans]